MLYFALCASNRIMHTLELLICTRILDKANILPKNNAYAFEINSTDQRKF